MRNFIATSVQNLRPSGIRRYFDIAAEMDDVITLGIGEPDFSTPRHHRGCRDRFAGNWQYRLYVKLGPV